MARLIRIYGVTSLVLVNDRKEIEDLLTHPALKRSLEVAGPLFNRWLLSVLRRQFTSPDGETIRSMRERGDSARKDGQQALFKHLSVAAERRPWDGAAIETMAQYAAAGRDRDRAMRALTYAIALPFLRPEIAGKEYVERDYVWLYSKYRLLTHARSPISLWGFILRRLGSDLRAQRALLKHLDGDDYGLHAVMVTLDNAAQILDTLYDKIAAQTSKEAAAAKAVPWLSIRTAPRQVIRQVPDESFTLPHVNGRVPANSIVIMNMRNSLTEDTPSGYAFAAENWSACPAESYIRALFDTVAERAREIRAVEVS